MRRGVLLLAMGVVAAALGVAAARAADIGTTTTGTTTTSSTTTSSTSTSSTSTSSTTTSSTTTSATTTPASAPLPPSPLPAGCMGAGTAALVPPSHPVVALGTPASNLGPSAYPSTGSVLAFASSTSKGSACKSQTVTLNSVSLFGGAVTASSVRATNGRGAATGLEINGSAVKVVAGETVPVDKWGKLTLDATVGRVTAPLVLRLLQARGSLPAGTAVAVAFAASALPIAQPRSRTTGSTRSRKHSGQTHHAQKHRRRQPHKPPPDFPASPFPFRLSGALADAAQDNAVVSIAAKYLGVPYQWGGASPTTGFDCSGLVKYVFAQLGVSLPHYAASQWYSPDAVPVPPKRLQPGDLVFFTGSDGTRKEPGHVGIYVGDGYLIDAPHTGAFVRIDRLTEPELADEYVGARRIVSQLLVARHLFGVTGPGPSASATAIRLDFPSPTTLGQLSALHGVAAGRTAAVRTASRGYWVWVAVVSGGLLLLFLTGGLAIRRRGTPDANPSTDSPS